jgi:hypothetical protein
MKKLKITQVYSNLGERSECGLEWESLRSLTAQPVNIQWDDSLPVFAKGEFLRSVGDEYGWLGGIDKHGTLRCILPYTIVRKAGLRLVRFRVQTIPCGVGLDVPGERLFLNGVVQYFRDRGADVIIPATTNTVFRTYPEGSKAAPYGSYLIDLRQSEDVLWRNIGRITRQNISSAQRDGVSIREAMGSIDAAYDLIRVTFHRSRMGFLKRDTFKRLVNGLGNDGKLLMAEYGGIPHSYCLFGFSRPCAYAIYAGNLDGQHQGANKLLYWEAIRMFRRLGIGQFDFVGARINPAKGSKQESINLLKSRFGATLSQGYMWKCALRPWRASVYSLAARVLKGGDIVDQEAHKLNDQSVSLAD